MSNERVIQASGECRLSFQDVGLKSWLVSQCRAMGLNHPTPLQCQCIPPALQKRDVIGCAKTGTGKTLAFALPILQQLALDPYGIFALILTPTRELAFQIADQFKAVGQSLNVVVGVVVGGRDMMEQSVEMARRPHVLIATPGRLADHIESGNDFPLDRLRFLVMDEADRLLDGQYDQQLKILLQSTEKSRPHRQTLLFSATITDALNRLQSMGLRRPFFWEDKSDIGTVAQLIQHYVLCPVDVKDAYLVYVVRRYCERNPDSLVLIFAQTCRECQALSLMFWEVGFQHSVALHSLIPQRERLNSLARFRSKHARILLCTDVASRGLDIPGVDLVVNHNVPSQAKNYVHRVGRAARAGKEGQALTFVTQYDVTLIKAVEDLIGCQLKELKVSDAKVSKHVVEVLVAKREAEIRLDEQDFGAGREVNRRKQMRLAGLPEDEVEAAIQQMRTRRLTGGKKRLQRLEKTADHVNKLKSQKRTKTQRSKQS